MSQFRCTCGFNILLTSFPNRNEGSLIWDDDFEKWQKKRSQEIAKFISFILEGKKKEYIRKFYETEKLDNIPAEDVIDSIISITDTYTRRVVHCYNCHRIHIQVKPGVNKYKSYVPD